MSALFDGLKKKGCDMDKTMERFLNDEEFYVDCLRDMLYDPGFEQLGDALKAHNVAEAFDVAHMLKGIVANMGLTSLFDKIVLIVEPLRAGDDSNLEQAYADMLAERDVYRQLL